MLPQSLAIDYLQPKDCLGALVGDVMNLTHEQTDSIAIVVADNLLWLLAAFGAVSVVLLVVHASSVKLQNRWFHIVDPLADMRWQAGCVLPRCFGFGGVEAKSRTCRNWCAYSEPSQNWRRGFGNFGMCGWLRLWKEHCHVSSGKTSLIGMVNHGEHWWTWWINKVL